MQKYSALRCLCAALCIMVIVAEVVTAVPPYADYENSIRDLYELLLQKEALEDRLGAHQVSRKSSNRTPSLRLRFGRRSDPNMLASPYLMAQESADRADN